MSERPILFSGEMVRALLDGRKTQTRRVVKEATGAFWDHIGYRPEVDKTSRVFWREVDTQHIVDYAPNPRCPYGQPGDRLWVRETFSANHPSDYSHLGSGIRYKADGSVRSNGWEVGYLSTTWKPSIFMPRRASRLTLEIVAVRVERLQEITEEDAKAEGIEHTFSEQQCQTVAGIIGTRPEDHGYKNYLWHGDYGRFGMGNSQSDKWEYQFSSYPTARASFSSLWEKINAKRGYPWDANPWVWVIEFK